MIKFQLFHRAISLTADEWEEIRVLHKRLHETPIENGMMLAIAVDKFFRSVYKEGSFRKDDRWAIFYQKDNSISFHLLVDKCSDEVEKHAFLEILFV